VAKCHQPAYRQLERDSLNALLATGYIQTKCGALVALVEMHYASQINSKDKSK